MDFQHINELIENLSNLQKERDVFIERVDKLNEKANSISEVVYKKIKSDYDTKINTLNSEIYPLLEELSLRKSELDSEIKKYEEELKEYMIEKEEIEVRKELGEFEEGEAEKLLQKLEDENSGNFDALNKLKEVMGNIEEALESEVNNNAINFSEGSDRVSESEPIEVEEQVEIAEEIGVEDIEDELPPLPPEPTVEPENTVDGTVVMEPQINFTDNATDGDSTMLFSSPVLEIVSGSLAGTEFRVKMGTTNIGSDQDNDIVLNEPLVAPKHAQITFGPDGFTIYDFNSPTGIEVNGSKVSEYLLKNEDVIQIGEALLKFLS